jgi:acyl-CoA thioesterase FadM
MNLYLRLIRILVAALLRRGNIAPLETAELTFRVLPNDLDPNWHVNNGRYLTVMDLGRIDLTLRMGFLHLVFQRGWMPVLGGAMIRYQRPLKLFQRYTLRTRLLAWDEKWLYLEQEFLSEGKRVALAVVKGLIRGKEGSIPTAQVMHAVGFDLPSPEFPEHLRHWIAADTALGAVPPT